MPSHRRNHTAVIRWLLFVCLLYSGSSLEAQIEAPTPVPTQEAPTPAAPSNSTKASGGSKENLVTYQLKHAKAAEVLKIWQKLLGGYVRSITVDERTNSIVLIADKATADEALATLALLDGELPSSIGSRPSRGVHSQLPLRKVTFKHARAADVLKIMRDLVGDALDDGKGFVVDEHTNSLLYLAQDVSSPEFEEGCSSLDTPTPSSSVTGLGASISVPALGPQPLTFDFSFGIERGESIESLKQRYNELEQQTHQLADKLKQSKSSSEPERTELKTAVRKSFEARQALQRAEFADLAQRMQNMRQSIDMRDKLSDKVVERRVEDLLNPNFKWEASRANEPRLANTSGVANELNKPTHDSGFSLSTRQSDPEHTGDYREQTPSHQTQYHFGDPATLIKEKMQGRWILKTIDAGTPFSWPLEVKIEGNVIHMLDKQGSWGPNLFADCEDGSSPSKSADDPLPVDLVIDPNGDPRTYRGIVTCDGQTLFLCTARETAKQNADFRPRLFVPGSKVTLIECRRAPTDAAKAAASNEVDLSTPQATLDTIHRYSVDHPMGVPVECYTEAALQELSGVMLQQLCFMSGLSQVGLQTGGVIGVKDNAPIVAGTAPSFHLSVDALLKQHSLPTPPEECTKAFELLAKLTLGAAFGSDESLVKPDRELFRMAAGILKSPKEFLPKAGELSERFNDISGDTESPKKESKAQPKYLIKIDGDKATATQIVDSDHPSVPMSFKLQRINQRWLVSEAFSDEILNQMISSMSQVLGAMSAIESEVANQRDSSDSKKAPDADKPLYSGHPISWWLDSYWDNTTATSKTVENIAQEYVASEAIRKLRELPECKAALEAALAKWFASVEHEVNEIQLVRAAKCIVVAAGTEHQELAVDYLCKIWSQLPTLSMEKQIERLGEETELNDLLKQLVLNDELAIQFAERLTNGTSSDRSFVTYYLFSSTGLKDEKDPKVAELNAWLHNHRELFIPAFAAALKDDSEHVRWFSLSSLVGLDLKHANVLSTLTSVIESDASPKVRWLAIEMISSKEILSVAKSQKIEVAPLLIKTLESDSSIDVRHSALGALMELDAASELVHATLLEWARCKDRLQVENALSLMLRNHEAGDRPQSIDELIELLSDPEWGTKVEVNYNNWSTHHRWARQYAIAILGQYAAHAHRAIPTLEAELARNNKDTLSFATEALDRVRGYCPDLPIDKLQGEWEFISIQKPEDSPPFFAFQASSDQQSASVITISGTQLKLGDQLLAELSHYRSGSRQGVALLLDPDGKKRHCNGRYDFNPEFLISSSSRLEWLKLEVRELLDDSDATERSKQVYEFRPLKREAR